MFSRQVGISAIAMCLAIPLFAQGDRPEVIAVPKSARPAAGSPKAALSTANSEVYKNITIAPGQSTNIDSNIDYSAADRVAITYVGASGTDFSGLEVQALWSVASADYWGIAETDNGGNFPYTNAGGSIFQVFGNQFRLVLVNSGKTTITITQLLVYARSL